MRKCSPQYIHIGPTLQLLSVGYIQQLCEGKNDLAVLSPRLMVFFSKHEPNCPLQSAFHLHRAEDKTTPP